MLKEKIRRYGRWDLDANRPEDSAAFDAYRRKHQRSKDLAPFVLERPGEPSKMIALRALRTPEGVGSPD